MSALIALLSHILFLLLLPAAWRRNQSSDYATFYEPVAHNIVSGRGLFLASRPALRYPPGIPMLFAATFLAADTLHMDRSTGLRILEAVLSALTSVLVCLVAMLVLSWRVALVASALWSTYPFHLWLTKQPDPTSVFSLLLLSSVFLFLKWSADGRHSATYGSLLGMLLGIAAIIKPIAIGLPLLIAGLAWICAIPCRTRQRALFCFCVGVAYLAPIAPWEIWAKQVSGQWIPLCTNVPNVLIDGLTLGTVRGLKPGWMPQPVHSFTHDAVADYKDLKTTRNIAKFVMAEIRDRPAVFAQLLLIKAARSWYSNESRTFEKGIIVIQLLYLPWVILGMRALSKGDRQKRNFLWIAIAITLYFWAMTTLISLPDLRYLVPAVSLLVIVMAVAVDAVGLRSRQSTLFSGGRARAAQLPCSL
jgi:Dolichyl-phosphate-mannose-protein mannosyltransferase